MSATRLAVRSTLFYSMLALGFLSLVTGFVLYLWPHGQRAGRLIFSGLNKAVWSERHTCFSVIAVVLVVVHLMENRQRVNLYVKTTLGKA